MIEAVPKFLENLTDEELKKESKVNICNRFLNNDIKKVIIIIIALIIL